MPDVNWCPDCGEPREKCLLDGLCNLGKAAAVADVESFCQQVEACKADHFSGYLVSPERAKLIVRYLRLGGFQGKTIKRTTDFHHPY